MKKELLLGMLLASAVGVSAQSKTVPYESTMYGADSGWTVINVDETTETWEDDDWSGDFNGTSYSEGKLIDFYKEVGDDWLISPAIRLEAGKEYKVAFWSHVKSGYDHLSLSWADSNTVESLSAETAKIYEYVTETWDWNRTAVVITPTETKDYYFGFHAYGERGRDYILLTGFQVKENVFVPGAPTDLAVTPDLNGALEATLTWKLPVADADGVALPADATFNKVEIYRDGTKVADLSGDAVSFVDKEADGLTAGKHTYGVAVTINGVTSKTTEITSRYIGPLPVYTLPWTAGVNKLTADDFSTYYTVIKGEGSTVKAGYGWALKNGRIQFDPRSKYTDEDDWLILPQINVEKAGIYQVRIKAQYEGDINPDLEVYMGNGRNVAAMTDKLGVFTTLPGTSAETYIAFEIAQPGDYFFAFHAGRKEIDSNKRIYIDEISIDATEALPLSINDLAAAVDGDKVTLTWTAPAKMNTGKAIEAIEKITIYRDDKVLHEITENIVPGAAMEYVDTPATGGVLTYYVVPVVGGKTPDTAAKTVTTSWVGDILQQLPYDLDFTQSVDLTLQKSFWNIYDNNKDSYGWSIKSAGMTLSFDGYDYTDCDDMLETPPFMITPGKYIATLNIKGGEEGFPLLVGFVADGDETHTIVNPATVTLPGNNSYAEYPVEINTELNGRHRLAFHAKSEYEDPYNVVMNRIQLKRDDNTQVGIVSVEVELGNVEYYDLTGMKVERPVRGSIYIVRTSDGKASKIIF